MKIFVNARFLTQPLSGVQRYAIECSRQIKNLLPNAIFVAPFNILHKDIAKELNVKIIGKHTGHIWEQYDLPIYLSRNNNPQLINLANTAPLFYKNNYLTIHDLAFYHHPEWNSRVFAAVYNFLIPKLANKAIHVFTVSQTIKDELIAQYKLQPQKISITYNGLSFDMLHRYACANLPKQKIILSVGSFNIRKNHHNLIKAFIQSGLKTAYQLVIVGDKNKVFKATSFNNNDLVNNNIKIEQHLSDLDLITYYQKAEVLVSLSMYEGFGIPLLEGIYYKCKVLCSDIPVYRELFNDYATFCDPLNIAEIITGLKNITADSNENMQKDLAGKRMISKYNYADSAQVIADVVLKQ